MQSPVSHAPVSADIYRDSNEGDGGCDSDPFILLVGDLGLSL